MMFLYIAGFRVFLLFADDNAIKVSNAVNNSGPSW
jgi:hypothetical protein